MPSIRHSLYTCDTITLSNVSTMSKMECSIILSHTIMYYSNFNSACKQPSVFSHRITKGQSTNDVGQSIIFIYCYIMISVMRMCVRTHARTIYIYYYYCFKHYYSGHLSKIDAQFLFIKQCLLHLSVCVFKNSN